MPLVDYPSSDSADEDSGPPPSKRRKDAGHGSASVQPSLDARPSLPPLPSAFHDLYASTVRQSVHDDPSLHHGRKRQIPHVVGNWPTHLYIEWHPTATQHDLLVKLIADVEVKLGEKVKLHNFLTSDLGSPLPLHISLSRPITLSTAEKDDFLDKITNTVHGSHTGVFSVSPSQLIWYKSPDSNRTFLVLQVTSKSSCDAEAPNSELASLLTRCNNVVTSFNQPALYQQNQKGPVGSAFHVSIGWTFDAPDAEAVEETVNLFGQSKFKALPLWKIEVSGVKAKVGNVVSHLALGELRRDSQSGRSGSLYE